MKIFPAKSVFLFLTSASLAVGISSPSIATPKTILISIDGTAPWLLNQYFSDGSIPSDQGLGLLKSEGYSSTQNITCSPSLTAACHISIGTGSNTNNTDIPQNYFHLVKSPFNTGISGFGAPIGGYPDDNNAQTNYVPTATPIWQPLQAAAKQVVSATFPGADGVNVTLPGSNPVVLQPASERTVSYTVPFGSSTGAPYYATGYDLNASNFSPASTTIQSQLTNAGISYVGTPQVANINNYTNVTTPVNLQAVAISTKTPGNFDSLVFFNSNKGIVKPGSVALPATGSAVINPSNGISSPLYLGTDSSGNQVGTSLYVTKLAGDLSSVHVVGAKSTFIPSNLTPSNPNVAASANDINTHVGFWQSDPDYSIPERIASGLTNFSQAELNAVYQDQSKTFIQYQTDVLKRAIDVNPNADLVLGYIDQPDASSHQYLLTDPRQATNIHDPSSISTSVGGAGQDPAVVAANASYVKDAYVKVNQAIQSVINKVGVDSNGKPKSNIIVVSDHGFEPFHTAVNLNAYLVAQGFDPTEVRAVTSGAAAQIYINLKGREPDGIVTQAQYLALQQKVVTALKNFVDTNPHYTLGAPSVNVIDPNNIYERPVKLGDPNFGLETNNVIGQDFGDVFGMLSVGYNFDGTQSPPVARLGDTSSAFLSLPNFYGAHGYDPTIDKLSAVFFAAGPDIGQGVLPLIHNIDVAPTIDSLLGVDPASTVNGTALNIRATPEPSTLVGAMLGLLGLGGLKQSRKK